MGKIKNIVGQKFGMLKVVKFSHTENKKSYWLCECECGVRKVLRADSFKPSKTRNVTKSCGCLNNKPREYARIHGDSRTKLYHVWASMKDRCVNPNGKYYKHYGGKGISVCDEWKNEYLSFKKWAIENGYKDGLTIDRIDVNGNYEPSNCRLITHREQQYNTTRNRRYTFQGETLTVTEWANRTGIKRTTLNARLNHGWDIDRALTEPINK